MPRQSRSRRSGRRSIRLRGFDYSTPGAYFVTICTRDRERLFGIVRHGKVVPSRAGRIARAAWLDLPRHYNHVFLDALIVMPDHVHGIIVLTDRDADDVPVMPSSFNVGAGFKPAPTPTTPTEWTGWDARAGLGPGPTPNDATGSDARAGLEPAPTVRNGLLLATTVSASDVVTARSAVPVTDGCALSEIVRGFKTFSARRINTLRGTPGTPVWQRGYYEHVIRSEGSLERIRRYIIANPARWEDD